MEVRRLCGENGIKVSSICSIYTAKRDLASPNRPARQDAVDYMKKVADLATGDGGRVPGDDRRPDGVHENDTLEGPEGGVGLGRREHSQGGEYSGSVGVNLTLEAWNRYETYLLNRFDLCLELLRDVGLPNAGVMGDTFY